MKMVRLKLDQHPHLSVDKFQKIARELNNSFPLCLNFCPFNFSLSVFVLVRAQRNY